MTTEERDFLFKQAEKEIDTWTSDRINEYLLAEGIEQPTIDQMRDKIDFIKDMEHVYITNCHSYEDVKMLYPNIQRSV